MEIAWSRICCPVDFSGESRTALTVATNVARRLGAELCLLHVVDHPDGNMQRELEVLRAVAEAEGAPRVTTAHTAGHPKSAIGRYVNEHGFDLVVMGTHGWTGRAHALVGSVAESTVRSARCPVMVVHGEWRGLASEAGAHL